jgi:protease-4
VRTFWKIAVTFGVLGFFVLLIAFAIAALVGGSDVSSLGGVLGGQVAVIPIHGTITMGGCAGGIFQAESCADVDEIKQQLKDADRDPLVKAIVFDIYSGGGNVVASRELMRAIKKTKKPKVAWIGEIGASGAYYAASAADKIIADEDSMTGSIGVIMFISHYYDLFDWVGINVTTIKAGNSKDLGSPYRPMTDDEQKQMQDMIEKVYSSFVSDVAANRKMDEGYVRNISQGKIYLGSEAKQNGLVDGTGGFEDAVQIAAELGNIKGEPVLKRPEKKTTLLDLLK